MSINKRILELVQIKAGGNKAKFAGMIDWMPQYMSRATKEGGPVGLAVVERILKAFPDVNPKWFVLGEGKKIIPDPELDSLIDKTIEDLRSIQNKAQNLSGAEVDALKRKLKSLNIQ